MRFKLHQEKIALPDRTNARTLPLFSFLIDSLNETITAKFDNWSPLELAAYFLDPDNRVPGTPEDQEIFDWAQKTTVKYIGEVFPSATVDASPPSETTEPINNFSAVSSTAPFKPRKKILPSASIDEFATYLTIPASSVSETMIEFWNRVKIQLPRLSLLALRVLSVPCSQTSSEREFSLLRLLCSHLRGRLDPQTTNKQLVCSAFLTKRNDLLQKKLSGNRVRSDANMEADTHRIVTLLNTNRQHALGRSQDVDSVETLKKLNLQEVLHDHRIPDSISIEDVGSAVLNPKKRLFLEIGDGERSDDEEFVSNQNRNKKRKLVEVDPVTSIRNAPGICTLCPLLGTSTLLVGHWTCSDQNIKPSPDSIFGDKLDYVVIADSDIETSNDGKQYLKQKFTFSLKMQKKGAMKFNGRRGFLGWIGEEVHFGY